MSRGASSEPRLVAAAALLFAISLLAAPDAHAVGIAFGCITHNRAADCGIGEAQLSAALGPAGDGRVRIDFQNAGADAVVVTRIVFQGPSLTGIVEILGTPSEVAFAAQSPAQNFPGGHAILPAFEGDFEAAAAPPRAHSGMGAGESLAIVLAIASGLDFGDVVDALASGELRIGLRAQAFVSGGSETLVNLPVHTPEPATALLLAAGSLALGLRRRAGAWRHMPR